MKNLIINIRKTGTHSIYGDMFDAWMIGGHQDSSYVMTGSQLSDFICKMNDKYVNGKWVSNTGMPVHYAIDVVRVS